MRMPSLVSHLSIQVAARTESKRNVKENKMALVVEEKALGPQSLMAAGFCLLSEP